MGPGRGTTKQSPSAPDAERGPAAARSHLPLVAGYRGARDESGALVAVVSIGERIRDGSWNVEFEVPPAPFYTVEVGTDDTEDQAFTEAEMAEGDLLLVANPPDC